MRKLKLIIIINLFCFCGVSKEKENKFIKLCETISLYKEVQIVAFEELYKNKSLDGKKIRISGVFHFYFEDVALYPSINSTSGESIWLRLDKKIAVFDDLLDKINGEYVEVIGIVNFSQNGHLGAYYATLLDVDCIKLQ